jgi:beta-hydroxylase
VSFYAGKYRRAFKAWNKTAYKITKFGLIIGLAAAIYYI